MPVLGPRRLKADMSSEILLQKLKAWRKNKANLEGVAQFRVFANKVLENIAELRPSNKEELMAVKGVRDRKFTKYGMDILAIVNGEDSEVEQNKEQDKKDNKPLSVSAYLDLINRQLSKCHARIQGEITSISSSEKAIYFSLKDPQDESVLDCLIWKDIYELCGIEFEIGMEVILEGFPDIYKPFGKLKFKASTAELVGEGALKKAYDQLRKKLEGEGLFLPERKKPIPDLPQHIGLITSETGAVIHDFLTNLGKHGFHITFMDSRVEGQAAVRDLVSAIDYFSDKNIDVLVIIRGGGSLESLQAFNNETLVRKIGSFHKPIICGIGHEKDVPLASLAADLMVSTPTAVTHILNKSWQTAEHALELNTERMFSAFARAVEAKKNLIRRSFDRIQRRFKQIFDRFSKAEAMQKELSIVLKSRIQEIKRNLANYPTKLTSDLKSQIKQARTLIAFSISPTFQKMRYNFAKLRRDITANTLLSTFRNGLLQTSKNIVNVHKFLTTNNPGRLLRLGYSIVRSSGGKIIKKISQIETDQLIDVWVEDGIFESKVTKIK